jgi:hypothetical protein
MARNGQNLPDGRARLMILRHMRSGAGSVCSTAIGGLEAATIGLATVSHGDRQPPHFTPVRSCRHWSSWAGLRTGRSR